MENNRRNIDELSTWFRKFIRKCNYNIYLILIINFTIIYTYNYVINDKWKINIINQINHLSDTKFTQQILSPTTILTVFVYNESELQLENYPLIFDWINEYEQLNIQSRKPSNCDFARHLCSELSWNPVTSRVNKYINWGYSTDKQYASDILIYTKILQLLNNTNGIHKFNVENRNIEIKFVTNQMLYALNQSNSISIDFYFVPFFFTWFKTEQKQIDELLNKLQYYNQYTSKQHVFLATRDHYQVMVYNKNLLNIDGTIIFYGPTNNTNHIVIPSANVEPLYQRIEGNKSNNNTIDSWYDLVNKKHFITVSMGLVNHIRKKVFNVLVRHKNELIKDGELSEISNNIQGIKARKRHSAFPPQQTFDQYTKSIFCPILEGDLPGQKRFYDVIVSGCLPVLLQMNNSKYWYGKVSINEIYPFNDIIKYDEFIINIDNDEFNKYPNYYYDYLINLYKNNKTQISNKLQLMRKYREYLLYDYYDKWYDSNDYNKSDAFSLIFYRIFAVIEILTLALII
eukprot:491410_1